MKKKCAMLLAVAMIAGVLSGCGSAPAGPTVLKDLKVEEYVTLGEYKGLNVSAAKQEVNQSRWDELVDNVYNNNVTAQAGGIMDRAVAQGDTVNIDYVGKKDDVAFDGGTAEGALLTIGSGRFIDGFEDGLVGVMPGETVDLNLTFPESYQNADLAGAAVVFTVTVNFIIPSELEDDVIAAFGAEEFKTVEELKQYVYDYLNAENRTSYDTSVENAVLEAFMESCTYKDMPKELVEEYKENIRTNVTNEAASMGVDADTYTNYYYNATLEEFVEKYSVESARQSVAFQAVANAENLNVSDEELDTLLQDYATKAGYDSIEAYIGENPKEDYREYFMFDKVMNFLKENAVITEG